MVEQVQALIDRIRTQAADAARQDAAAILAAAKQEAQALVDAAREEAAALRGEAERAAVAAQASGRQSLQQAARDLLLRVGQQLEDVVQAVVAAATDKALTPDLVAAILTRVAETIAKRAGGRLTVVLSPADKELLTGAALQGLRERLEHGIDVRIDPDTGRGFRLTLAGDAVQHDFDVPAIAAALGQFVRPRLAELVMQAALPAAQRA